MRTIYNLITFLAAVAVLTFAGWQGYLHYQAGAFNGVLPDACHVKCAKQECPCLCGCAVSSTCNCAKK